MPDIDDPYLEPTEPTASQVGVDAPGYLGSVADLVENGIYNGNFRLAPADASAGIDVASSTSGSNFVWGWRFVQSSNATITGSIRRSATQGAGSNFRFSFSGGTTTGDAAFLEQIVDIGGSATGDAGSFIRVTGRASNNGTLGDTSLIAVRAQYLASDGTIAGMPPEASQTYNFLNLESTVASGYSAWSLDYSPDQNPAPANARYIRYRIEVQPRTSAAGSTLDLFDVRRESARTILRLVDRDRTTAGLYDIVQSGSNLYWQPSSTTALDTTTKRLLNWQLVAIPFSLVNVPANTTTEMQLWGDTALSLATPRTSSPWGGSFVGMSVRMSAAPTGGGTNAIQFRYTVGGSSVGTAISVDAGSGVQSTETSEPIGNITFTSGQGIGVSILTKSGFTPTSMDVAVVLFVALRYSGS